MDLFGKEVEAVSLYEGAIESGLWRKIKTKIETQLNSSLSFTVKNENVIEIVGWMYRESSDPGALAFLCIVLSRDGAYKKFLKTTPGFIAQENQEILPKCNRAATKCFDEIDCVLKQCDQSNHGILIFGWV